MKRSRLFSLTLALCALPLASGPTPYGGLVFELTIGDGGMMVTSWAGSEYLKDMSGNTLDHCQYAVGDEFHMALGAWFDMSITLTSTDVVADQCTFDYSVTSAIFGVNNAGASTAPLGEWLISYTPTVADPSNLGDVLESLPPSNTEPGAVSAHDSLLCMQVNLGSIHYWVYSQSPNCNGGNDIAPSPVYTTLDYNNPSSTISSLCYGDSYLEVLSWAPVPYVYIESTGGPYPFDTNTFAPFGTWLCTFDD